METIESFPEVHLYYGFCDIFKKLVRFFLSVSWSSVFAIPIALYLHACLVRPLALLGVIVIGWTAVGIGSGSIAAGATFGLAFYAIGLSPAYVILYLLLGSGEYYAHKQEVL